MNIRTSVVVALLILVAFTTPSWSQCGTPAGPSEWYELIVPASVTAFTPWVANPPADFCQPTAVILTVLNPSSNAGNLSVMVSKEPRPVSPASCGPAQAQAFACVDVGSPNTCLGGGMCNLAPGRHANYLVPLDGPANSDYRVFVQVLNPSGSSRAASVSAEILYTTPGVVGVHCETTNLRVQVPRDSCL